MAMSTQAGAVYFWDSDGGWIEEANDSRDGPIDSRGGMAEGVGIPSRKSIHARSGRRSLTWSRSRLCV